MQLRFGKYNQDNLGGVLIHFLLAFFIMLMLVILYFYVYLPSTTNHGETITVPDVEGKLVSELEEELLKKDLRYEVADSSYSAEAQPLTVLKQYPHPGAKVKEGRKIYITINSITPPSVPMPNLTDGSVLNAEVVLKSNELKLGRIHKVAGPFNMVKEMRYKGSLIEAGVRIPKGSVIELVVMDGNMKDFPIENWIGVPFDEAAFTIRGNSLNLGEVTLVGGDTTGLEPVVLKQKPAPGEKVKVGDGVDLWIGKAGTEVPDEDGEEVEPENK